MVRRLTTSSSEVSKPQDNGLIDWLPWNSINVSTAGLTKRLSYSTAIWWFQHVIWRLRDISIFGVEASYGLTYIIQILCAAQPIFDIYCFLKINWDIVSDLRSVAISHFYHRTNFHMCLFKFYHNLCSKYMLYLKNKFEFYCRLLCWFTSKTRFELVLSEHVDIPEHIS